MSLRIGASPTTGGTVTRVDLGGLLFGGSNSVAGGPSTIIAPATAPVTRYGACHVWNDIQIVVGSTMLNLKDNVIASINQISHGVTQEITSYHGQGRYKLANATGKVDYDDVMIEFFSAEWTNIKQSLPQGPGLLFGDNLFNIRAKALNLAVSPDPVQWTFALNFKSEKSTWSNGNAALVTQVTFNPLEINNYFG